MKRILSILVILAFATITYSQTENPKYSVKSALTYLEWVSINLDNGVEEARYIWLDLMAQQDVIYISDDEKQWKVCGYVNGEHYIITGRDKDSPGAWEYVKVAAALEWFKLATHYTTEGEAITLKITSIMTNPPNF